MTAWDQGIRWFSRRTVEPTELPVEVAYVREYVLRAANDNYEDAHIERLIKAATRACEEATHEAIMPQTRQIILSGFPWGAIVLPGPPLINVESLAYVDEDGDSQTLAGSPAEYEVIPSGPVEKAKLTPLYDESWPSTRCQADAVTVTFECGYEDVTAIPEPYITGILLMVGELYKQRSLSVQNTIQNIPAVLQLGQFWLPRY